MVLGERWGCAVLATAVGSTVECWDAPKNPATPARAWTVPWLKDRQIEAGPERVCEFAWRKLTFRCWQRPRRGDSAGTELPSNQEWLNPHHTAWDDVYSRSDRVETTSIGGTFSCLKATKDHAIWCLGDDRFGQLGGSSPVPAADADRYDSAFVQHTWPAEALTLGTWHACALAAPQGYAFGGQIACWGRGDYGQLGAPAPDRCEIDGKSVACARKAQAGVTFASEVVTLLAGDLFTCTSVPGDISCWGASRDGFFGTRACPARLRRAWPTLHGTVAAPRAKCSSEPAHIGHVHGFQQSASAGPRGICYDEDTPLRCVGGIHTPRGSHIKDVVVSPGADANACGIRDGKVVCWGENYSPRGALDAPVTIALKPVLSATEVAMLGPEAGTGFAPSCLVREGCDYGPARVPACTPNLQIEDWSALRGSAAAFVGKVVNVRGAVAVGPTSSTLKGCVNRNSSDYVCCNRAGATVVLGDAPALALAGQFCSGDDSALCCNAPAYGDILVASGHLEKSDSATSGGLSPYQLTDVTFCKSN